MSSSSPAPEVVPSDGRRLRALVTNDDGIEAPGLDRLAAFAAEHFDEVVVVAPSVNQSGASCSLFSAEHEGRIGLAEHRLPLSGLPATAATVSPAYITVVALLGGFGRRPDVVLSGINEGANTGAAVLHSGTVGAVLAAAAHHVSGLAVSVDLVGANGRVGFDTPLPDGAAAVISEVIGALHRAPAGTALNLNVPAGRDPLGLRWAELARAGQVTALVLESRAADRLVVRHVGSTESEAPDSDAALLADGWATVTALAPVKGERPVGGADVGSDVDLSWTPPTG